MSIACPCGQDIPIADINVAEGVALCRGCGKLSRLMDLATPLEEAAAIEAANAEPPKGCRIDDLGGQVVLVASARSLTTAGPLLFFAAFWISIVSVFVLIAIAGLWTNFVGPIPSWFPAPAANNGSGGSNNSIGSGMPLGMTLFLCVFLIPFVTIGLGVLCAALVALLGRVEVRLRGPDGAVFTGIGPIGWRRRFDASRVKAVKFAESSVETNGKRQKLIAIEGEEKTVKFGSVLTDQRRVWLAGALKTVLMPRGGTHAR
ncbi:MAG: hypothetical protein KF699_01700 [Phycisphaeraceae bacterium]|nr:hypothetical protein [Phycisphaeraceae bacterium]